MNKFDKLVNFRDLGGTKGAEGKTIKPHRLLRSAEPSGLSDSDKSVLVNEYGLKTIIDLRTAGERGKQPDDDIPGVKNVFIDIMKDVGASVPDPENFLTKLKTPKDTNEFMQNTYGVMIDDSAAQKGFREVIKVVLEQKEGAVLFHCTTGKDRTGIALAIILTILGVSKADIMEDYLMTNIMRKSHNEKVLSELKKKGIGDNQLKAIEIALGVKESYLNESYAIAKKHYGSFEGYIEEALLVGPHMIKDLRAMYLK